MNSVDRWRDFKVGEDVRCIDATEAGDMKKGDILNIKDIQVYDDGHASFMFLIQGDFFHFGSYRFEKIPSTERPPLT